MKFASKVSGLLVRGKRKASKADSGDADFDDSKPSDDYPQLWYSTASTDADGAEEFASEDSTWASEASNDDSAHYREQFRRDFWAPAKSYVFAHTAPVKWYLSDSTAQADERREVCCAVQGQDYYAPVKAYARKMMVPRPIDYLAHVDQLETSERLHDIIAI
jgi:hypothetical protein